METAFQFRQDMYEYMNVTMPRTPPRNVLLFMRQDKYVPRRHKLSGGRFLFSAYSARVLCVYWGWLRAWMWSRWCCVMGETGHRTI
jgi:hypothetical protein